jgi:adenylate cyclase
MFAIPAAGYLRPVDARSYNARMTRAFSPSELAAEAGVSPDLLDWLVGIEVLKPGHGRTFRSADVFRVKLVAALLEGGFTAEQIEWAVSERHLNLDRVDEHQLVEPGPRSSRTFHEFTATAGPRGSLLPAVYVAMGLPPPDPSAPIHTDEEERLLRFLGGWGPAQSDETVIRAARLIAEGTRMVTMGWSDLIDEQVAGPARERLYRGEIQRFPEEAREVFSTLLQLQPRMMEWLIQRYNEQRNVSTIVEGLEEFLASRGMAPPPPPAAPPAVVFVDLSGYTRLTEERGDEVAVRYASTLQRQAEAVATANDGRLVKLLGDGAMLRFGDAGRGLEAALSLVRALSAEGTLSAHAGVHAGPVIERDLDMFGRTVNLASRIAEAAGPGDVLVSEAVMEAVDRPDVRFERAERIVLKGIPEPIVVFRVTRR